MANPPTKRPFLSLVCMSIRFIEILKQSKVKRCNDSIKCDQIITENNDRCAVNVFIFACSVLLLLSNLSVSDF